ncbi:DUF1573 domain-containing protein [Aquimarina muelleri]|nr:DUF1573 domain-containing protein [Aquimarina muelleri]MCX2762685.1 DUF1573 domain-containing protein [Aquimarina muelleri]
MKNSILILSSLFLLSFISCKDTDTKNVALNTSEITASKDVKPASFPIMAFTETTHDFGVIDEGDIVEHKFTFTNTGAIPLVIISAKGSCGCTVSKWPKEPISPGAAAELLVTFNSNGKPNMQTKQVTITTNTQNGTETLKIKAMVTPKKKVNSSGTPISK